MQVDSSELIRNVALVGHNDTGKTTLASGLLYTSGVASRLNRVEDGNAVTDFDTEEVARGLSIGLAICHLPWQRHKVNLLDTPGSGIFLSEARCALRAADAALVCINTVAGVEVSTEKIWDYALEMAVPVAFHLTKMDRENADFPQAVAHLREVFGRTVVPVQIPIGESHDLRGVVDLIELTAWLFPRDGNGQGEAVEVPTELADAVADWRAQLVEAVAESDEQLMETFFEAGDLSTAQLTAGLRKAVAARGLFPLTVSSAGHGIGNSALLDFMVGALPSPLDRKAFPATDVGGAAIDLATSGEEPASALVFKTLSDPYSGRISLLRVVSGTLDSDTPLWNSRAESEERIGHLLAMQGKQGQGVPRLLTGDIGGVAKLKVTHTGDTLCQKRRPVKLGWFTPTVASISFAIEPKAKGDEEKIGEACARLLEEDITLRANRDPETGQFLLSGTGQLHIEIAVAKLKSRYKVEVILHPPKVPYRETVRRAANGHGRHKKQTGGRGQFADCQISIEPLPRGEQFEFVDEIFGGAIPHNYRPAVEKGIRESAERGYVAGFPVVEFRVRLLDGQYHDVDSSEMAFKIAGSLAFKDAMANAAPVLLEPIMQVDIATSEEFMGDIMGDLAQRRGRPQGMESKGTTQIIKAQVPLAEMLTYSQALRSMTQGRSSFTMEFSHYDEVPRIVQEKVIADAKSEAAAAD